MTDYKYLLFDLDGTLTDPQEGITRCVQYALRHFGIEETDLNKLRPFIGPPLVWSFENFYGMTEDQAVEATRVYRERFSTIGLFENKVLPGVPQMLEKLRSSGKKIMIASSKPEVYVVRILDRFDLTKYFDLIVGASMDEKKAGKADVIEDAIRRAGLTEADRAHMLMIGDRLHDMEGAKECGLDSLGVYTGFAEPGELEKAGATYIRNTVAEMEEFLLSH